MTKTDVIVVRPFDSYQLRKQNQGVIPLPFPLTFHKPVLCQLKPFYWHEMGMENLSYLNLGQFSHWDLVLHFKFIARVWPFAWWVTTSSLLVITAMLHQVVKSYIHACPCWPVYHLLGGSSTMGGNRPLPCHQQQHHSNQSFSRNGCHQWLAISPLAPNLNKMAGVPWATI